MRYIAFITLLGMTMFGCGSDGKTETGDTADTTTTGDDDDDDDTTETLVVFANWTDDGLTPEDTDGDDLPDINCGDSVTIEISDPMEETAWNFGMAETGSPAGWYGEDCYLGYATFTHCHPVAPNDTLTEAADCSAMSVVDGSVTLFDAEKDSFLTYYLEDSSGNCFVWGDQVSYYGPLGCTEMM